MFDGEELARPLDPIYAGVSHNFEYEEAVKKRRNTAKYNRDMAKIIDKCWDCPKFGASDIQQNREELTKCQKCRQAMLKAIELKEKSKH